jgi:Zn-dependent peptidase ImmA (M78 family)
MTWNKIYKQLLNYSKEVGINVKHVSMSNQFHGEYDCGTNTIYINKNVKSYETRCKTLAHEIGHSIDYTYDRFPVFFKDLGRYSPKKMRLVIEAEQSASQHAIDILTFYKKSVEFEEFDYYLMALFLVPIWRQIYFD